MTEQIFWDSETQTDLAAQRDSTTTYESGLSGHVFWADWLGPPQFNDALTWLQPKLNWTAVDYYNFEDLNRVENNTEIVAELIRNFEDLPLFVFINNRNMEHVEFTDSLNRIESIQDRLRQRVTPRGWLQNKTNWTPNDSFTFEDAKRLENNLYLLHRRYTGNLDLMAYCGAFTCGEVLI